MNAAERAETWLKEPHFGGMVAEGVYDLIRALLAEHREMKTALDAIAKREPKSHYWGDHGMGGWDDCSKCEDLIELAQAALKGKGEKMMKDYEKLLTERVCAMTPKTDSDPEQPTLRDQFAMHCPITFWDADRLFGDNDGSLTLEQYVGIRFQYADEAMKAREVKP